MALENASELLVDRKSKFQARCCALYNQQDVPRLLETLVKGDKHIAKASHMHMYAWRTCDVEKNVSFGSNASGNNKGKRSKKANKDNKATAVPANFKNVQQGCSDCGEAGAGQRLLTLLERASVVNVLVIVTRWYGGTPLGSARFRHISSTAVESLKRGGFLP